MSGLEIERKFLVRREGDYRSVAHAVTHIQQGYIPAENATVRVRTRDDRAFLTIKGKPTDANCLSRYEFETEIAMDEARELLKLCRQPLIDKHRYLVNSGPHVFEIDEFHGANAGLVVAEVELKTIDEPFTPLLFIGPEVTRDKHFRNSQLVQHPFSEWREMVPEAYRHD